MFSGVTVYGGPTLSPLLNIPKAHSLHHEYNSLSCTVEIVDDVYAAIEHIHDHGRYLNKDFWILQYYYYLKDAFVD